MKTKLCSRCKITRPLSEFGNRQNHGKTVGHTQCKKCRVEIHFQWLRARNEANGKLFASTRLHDSARADRLDRFRGMVKQELPLTAEKVIARDETDEYHLFYRRNRIV